MERKVVVDKKNEKSNNFYTFLEKINQSRCTIKMYIDFNVFESECKLEEKFCHVVTKVKILLINFKLIFRV